MGERGVTFRDLKAHIDAMWPDQLDQPVVLVSKAHPESEGPLRLAVACNNISFMDKFHDGEFVAGETAVAQGNHCFVRD